MLDFKGSWEDHLHLVKFSYNKSFQASIQMTPYEALYGRKCRSPMCCDDIGERRLLGPELISQTVDTVAQIRNHLKAAPERQKSWADTNKRPLTFVVGDMYSLRYLLLEGSSDSGAGES